MTKVLFAIGLVLAAATSSRADIGVVVLEPVDALGFFTRVGHGTYLSNICPDGSLVTIRRRTPGERGSLVSKYSPLSENEDFDWAIEPFEEYMHGFGSPDLVPIIATRKLHLDLQLGARRHPQIPGTFARSRDVLVPLENMYKSIGFAPWWFFEGYRLVALGAIVYHQPPAGG